MRFLVSMGLLMLSNWLVNELAFRYARRLPNPMRFIMIFGVVSEFLLSVISIGISYYHARI